MPWRSRRRSPWRAAAAKACSWSIRIPECLGEITAEYPFLQERYEDFRVDDDATRSMIDRRRVQMALFREAEHAYETEHRRKSRALAAPAAGALQPQPGAGAISDLTASLFDLTVAARSIVDENYAWEVWETASRYPHQQTSSDIADRAHLGRRSLAGHPQRIRLRRRLPSTKRRLRPSGLKPRKKEKFPGEWAQRVERRQHLLLSAGRHGDRGFRPLPEEEGQERSFRRARRASSRSPRRCSTASICARPSATGTRARIYVRKFRRCTAKSARWS